MMIKKFGSQMILVYPDQKIIKTSIREPFFSAGKQFGWTGNSVGIGLSEEIIEFAFKNDYDICVSVGENPNLFWTSAKTWKSVCESKKQFFDLHDGKRLYVYQWSRLEKV